MSSLGVMRLFLPIHFHHCFTFFLSCVLFNSLSLNDLAWFPIACKWVVLVKLTELLFGSAGREFVFCFVCFFFLPLTACIVLYCSLMLKIALIT